MTTKQIKIMLEFGDTKLISFIPYPSIIWDPEQKNFEIGIYFLKYFLTINFRK